MPRADDRQAAFDDAVEAYNHAHPTTTLPRSATGHSANSYLPPRSQS